MLTEAVLALAKNQNNSNEYQKNRWTDCAIFVDYAEKNQTTNTCNIDKSKKEWCWEEARKQ